MLSWLLQEGPKAAKHRGRWHPPMTFFLHYLVVSFINITCHDWLLKFYLKQDVETLSWIDCATSPPPRQKHVGAFLGVYFLIFFSVRLALQWREHFYIEFYRQTFLCSVTIFMTGLGLCIDRPILSQAFCVAVGMDQLLWYVDLTGYCLFSTFPIGVSKYLFKPGTTWTGRLTSTHHVWTIPLVLWACGGLHILALPLSALAVLSNVVPSRLLTPFTISTGDKDRVYLNLNLAYELWSDIKIKFLYAFEDRIPYFYRMFFWWCCFNTIVYMFLKPITLVFLGPGTLC